MSRWFISRWLVVDFPEWALSGGTRPELCGVQLCSKDLRNQSRVDEQDRICTDELGEGEANTGAASLRGCASGPLDDGGSKD